MNIKPKNKKIYVLPDEEEQKSAGGLLVPGGMFGASVNGTIVAIADNQEEFKVGEKVFYPFGAGVEFTHEGVKYLLMNEHDILGAYDNKN